MDAVQTRDAPLNHGVDYERALDRLNLIAGGTFRRLWDLRKDPSTTAEALREAQEAAQAAQARAGDLRASDHEEIARILAAS